MKRAIIMGATSGIGCEVAKLLVAQGWKIGIAGRRTEALAALQATAPDRITIYQIDITKEDAPNRLLSLIAQIGGMDLYFHSSGIGFQNRQLDLEIELRTIRTNAEGFVRMVGTAFNYFAAHGGGHIAAISSIAGTKGLGAAPAYSATKAMNQNYLEALQQLANMRKEDIHITDIRPGFVATNLIGDGRSYPLVMKPKRVAKSIVKAILKRRSVVTIDWLYCALVFFWRLIPRCIWVRLNISNG